MKKLRLRTRISLNTVAIWTAFVCVMIYAMMEHVSTTISVFSMVKMPLMYLGGFCLLTQTKQISRLLWKRNYFRVLAWLAFFCLMLGLTILFSNSSFGHSPLTQTVRLILYLLELFLTMMLLAESGRSKAALNVLFWFVLVLVIVSDALMFTRVLTFRSGKFENYLVGTKFAVSYRHMNLLVLWAIRSKRKLRSYRFSKLLIFALTAYIVLTAIRVDCMTGILGGLGLLALLLMMDSPRRNKLMRFTSPNVLVLTMIASVVFVLVVESIMALPVVRYVVEEILGRDATITGRTDIYRLYLNNMQDSWLWGYGFGNGNYAAVSLFKYENVQNGLLQWVLQVGVPTTVVLVLVLQEVFRQIKSRNRRNMDKILPLVAMIYLYIILSTVETTFDMGFIFWFALVFMLVNEKDPAALQPRTGTAA